jgi:hypothetical protein
MAPLLSPVQFHPQQSLGRARLPVTARRIFNDPLTMGMPPLPFGAAVIVMWAITGPRYRKRNFMSHQEQAGSPTAPERCARQKQPPGRTAGWLGVTAQARFRLARDPSSWTFEFFLTMAHSGG